MRVFSKFLLLVAATSFAFVGSAVAQLQTYQTQTAYAGSVITFSAGATQGQIFTNVSAVKAMTYNFFSGSGSSTATTLTATFGQWDANSSSFIGGTTVDFGTINVTASGGAGWSTFTNGNGTYASYAQTFDLTTLIGSYPSLINATYGYLTSSSVSYALMLTNTSGTNTGLGLGLTNNNAFAFGESDFSPTKDWVFSQIVVAPGNQQLVPVPESSTVASLAVGAMVFGLVGFRMNQRRRAAVTPVVAA